jgi:hypothetical protein
MGEKMKSPRKIGIGLMVVLTAVAMLAVTASPAAAATKLCKAKEAPCKAGNFYLEGTTLNASATNTEFVIEPFIGGKFVKVIVLCTGAEIEGETTADEGVWSQYELMSFVGCTNGGKACTVTAANMPSLGLFGAPNGGNGTLQLEVSVDIHCPMVPLKCRYGATPTLDVTGGNPATIRANQETLNFEETPGFENCPSIARWWATYTVNQPAGPLFVTT